MSKFTNKDGHWIGRHTETGKPIEVRIIDGEIHSVVDAPEQEGLPWISAGWIDLQVNGCMGYDFNSDNFTTEDVNNATRHMWTTGVTTYLPTVITGLFENLDRAVAVIAEARRTSSPLSASIGGIHLEGPYLSSEDGPRGAHSIRFIKDPDWNAFQQLRSSSEDGIALVTLAPEREGALEFIRLLVQHGIIASIGHSAANSEQIASAVEAGASMSTHLGNGSHLMLPRHPNYIWDQLAEDRLSAGLIADGHHLPLSVLKTMLRAKGNKAFLVSDAVSLAGLPPGIYEVDIGNQVLLQENGRLCTMENQKILAGSSSMLNVGIHVLLKELQLPIGEVIPLVTKNPAEAMGWSRYGTLSKGSIGNLTLFHYDNERPFEVTETVVGGISVYHKS
jgi:N-acetylglucosamine-6-phosphate deacetylase